MKIIVTTSNKYLHLLPIFCYLFNKNWSDKQLVEIVCYDLPKITLPDNFFFTSLGKQQGDATNFTRDLRKYFAEQDPWFIWMMEDSFIKKVDFEKLEILKSFTSVPNMGRINLSHAAMLQAHYSFPDDKGLPMVQNTQTALYRLCTQPSIWNREFILQYMQKDLSPWQFETQDSFNDNWRIIGPTEAVVEHNEGVTKWDIHKYNFNGIPDEVIQEMKDLKII